MISVSILLFLGALATASIVIFAGLHILDFFKVAAVQKLCFLRWGLGFLFLAPGLFGILRFLAWKSIEITLSPPTLIIEPAASNGSSVILQQTSFSVYLLRIYLVVFSLMLLRILFSYLQARWQLRGGQEMIILGEKIFLHEKIQAPMSFGFFRPRIFFPADLQERWTVRETELALAHERIHLSRGDQWWKLISLFERAVLFFAPWMWALPRKLELEMEISCDEETCRKTKADVSEYGQLLLDLVCGNRFRNGLVTNMTDSTLKRRILAMRSRTAQRPLLVFLTGILFLLAGSAAVAVTGGLSPARSAVQLNAKIFVGGVLLSSPRITTLLGEEAVISQRVENPFSEMSLRVLPTEVMEPSLGTIGQVKLEMEIEYHQGGRDLHSLPMIIALYGETATIEVGDDQGENFKIEVLVTKP